MSRIENEDFLERAWVELREFVRTGEWNEAKRLIDEVAEYGFTRQAVDMCRTLLSSKMRV